MSYQELKKLFDAGTDDHIVGGSGFTKTWKNTTIGLVLQVEEEGTGEIQYLQVVGGKIYYAPGHPQG